jgi:hypothetical protein
LDFSVQEENSGSTRKFVEVYLLFYQLNSCTTQAEREWTEGTFLRQQRKFTISCTAESNTNATQKQHEIDTKVHFTEKLLIFSIP